ncbi:RodZ domain-containing protein [Marinomonas rhizomae]|uniref:Cytoskeleton protein RodZ n=1 Tax=Marinomonas rhizomae TaxID=491948 RepID=A0A366IVD3_9GAMM|nr:RodZ domain-containing protein [Marinomonas rhizomae]RBP78039.1 cytoskeleton protein RodZ [Marinomonas rhizomae]
MTTELQTDVSVSNTNMDTINIGNRLKAKRLELEFDERYVATELKIPIDQVRALEANNFKYFRSVTFARGFLKSYCRLLQIDPSEILRAFDSEREGVELTIKPVDKVNKQTNFGDPIVIFISVVIVAVLVFLVFWWPSQTSQPLAANDVKNEVSETVPASETASDESLTDTSSEPAAAVANVSDLNSNVEEAVDTNSDTTDSHSKVSTDNDVVTGLSAETMAILEEAGVKPEDVVRATAEVPAELATAPKLPSYTNEIEMTFDADCWAEIRDSSGKILFSGVKSANSQLSLTGKAPYRVVLGYAKGVSSLKYKGEEFDFSSFTRKDLARFELK